MIEGIRKDFFKFFKNVIHHEEIHRRSASRKKCGAGRDGCGHMPATRCLGVTNAASVAVLINGTLLYHALLKTM